MGLSLILALTGCSKANFGSTSSSSSSAGSGTGGSVTGNVNGTGAATSVNTSASLPKVQFSSQACAHGTDCEVDLTLDASYPHTVSFSWATNDQAYLTPHSPPYGQPNVQYIPNSGQVTFGPGQTVMKVYVQNINPDDYEIAIAIVMSNCTYNGATESCANMIEL